jgi:ankyrin repeat protein
MDKNEKLLDACGFGNFIEAKRLINRLFFKPDVNAKDKYGRTPLILISEKGPKDLVELLIAKGADVNAKDNYGETPLSSALKNVWNEDIINLLVAKGANIKADDHSGWKLMRSAFQNFYKITEILINNCDDVNAKGKDGFLPLIFASGWGAEGLVKLLITKGADVNAKDASSEQTSLHAAAKNGHEDVVKLLISKGADVNSKDKFGETPLIGTIQHYSEEERIVKLLIAKGADVNAKDRNGDTALFLASERYYRKITKLLIDNGAVLKSYSVKNELISALSQNAVKFIYEALSIIESHVEINKEWVQIDSEGTGGIMMKAVHHIKEAFRLHSDNPLIHYTYASCLHLTLQNKSAEIEMRNCIQSHPDFILAKYALDGWGQWQSMFSLPIWGTDTKTIHPYISQLVQKSTLFSVRDGIVPRAAIFLRYTQGDFTNIKALKTTKISIASVISSVSDPQVIGIYANIYDDPANPYGVEILQIPFTPRGNKIRTAYEYLCIQEDIDFVIIDQDDKILLNRRISFPLKMRITNDKILKMLQGSDGKDFSNTEIVNAIKTHQDKFSISMVDFNNI